MMLMTTKRGQAFFCPLIFSLFSIPSHTLILMSNLVLILAMIVMIQVLVCMTLAQIFPTPIPLVPVFRFVLLLIVSGGWDPPKTAHKGATGLGC